MTSFPTDICLAGLPISTRSDHNLGEPLEIIASQFVDEHRRLLSPRIEDYARTYRHLSKAIRRTFPIILKLESTKHEVREQFLGEQFPLVLPISRIRDYVLEGELRRNAWTISYRAVDTSRNKCVELTVIPWKASEVPTLRFKFLREAAIATSLWHTGIMPTFDYGIEAGFCFAVTPHWKGSSGHDLIEESAERTDGKVPNGSFNGSRFYCIAKQLTLALQYIHSRGTLHNNIRPSSIFVCRSGNAYLRDFGLGPNERTTMQSPSRRHNERSVYTAPECNSERADERSDVFSLGVSLYELACRRFITESELKNAHSETRISRWLRRTTGHQIPRELLQVLRKATAVLPQNRFQSAATMADALRHLSKNSPPKPAVRPVQVCKWLSKLISLRIAPAYPDSLFKSS